MSKKDDRIADLERRVKELEERPQQFIYQPYYIPSPFYVPAPYYQPAAPWKAPAWYTSTCSDVPKSFWVTTS